MTTRRTTIGRAAAAVIIAGTVSFVGAGTAAAGHVHCKQIGNGACMLLAQHGGEGDVDLPFARAGQIEANRAHPLHPLVHLGQPGDNFAIGVAGTGSDPCAGAGNYLND